MLWRCSFSRILPILRVLIRFGKRLLIFETGVDQRICADLLEPFARDVVLVHLTSFRGDLPLNRMRRREEAVTALPFDAGISASGQ